MNTMQPHPAESVFNAISQFIAESKTRLEAGKTVDLSDLDTYVDTLCETILDLSQEERLLYADRLQRLLSEVTALGEQLVEERDIIAGQIYQVGKHSKASSAYRIIDTIDALVQKDENNGDKQ